VIETVMGQFDPKYPCVYRVALGYRVVSYLFALVAVGAIGYLMFDYPSNPKDDLVSLSIVIFFMFPLGIYYAACAARGRLTITADTVEYRRLVDVRTIRRDDIVGYYYYKTTKGAKHQVLVSKTSGELTIDSPFPFDTTGYFNEWLYTLPNIRDKTVVDMMDPQQAQEVLDEKPKVVDWARRDD
jgi:hypothetical protein